MFWSFFCLILYEPLVKSKNKEDTTGIQGNMQFSYEIRNVRFLNYKLKQHGYGKMINFECKFKANLPFKLSNEILRVVRAGHRAEKFMFVFIVCLQCLIIADRNRNQVEKLYGRIIGFILYVWLFMLISHICFFIYLILYVCLLRFCQH